MTAQTVITYLDMIPQPPFDNLARSAHVLNYSIRLGAVPRRHRHFQLPKTELNQLGNYEQNDNVT